MKPVPRFANLDRSFWALVKFVSEQLGYSERVKRGQPKRLRRYAIREVVDCLASRGLDSTLLASARTWKPTRLGGRLIDYLNTRARILESRVEPLLMDRQEARREFNALRRRLRPKCSLPMNKQKGKKRHPAYMVGIVNMLTESALRSRRFDDSPKGLTVITRNRRLVRTLSRWMDGAYPSIVDPRAIWEVKEYYGTTTFGSRVADGVYESMLDGEELAEVRVAERRRVLHYLIVDDHFTWWEMGRSYLCRILDMLHAGQIDEVIFGREVLRRWPQIVRSWR